MIVKIQRPMNGPGPCLIYNQTKTLAYAVSDADSPAVMLLFRPGQYKVFHHAIHRADGKVEIGRRAPDQDW